MHVIFVLSIGILLGALIGFVLITPGRSGYSLIDHIDNFMEKLGGYLPW